MALRETTTHPSMTKTSGISYRKAFEAPVRPPEPIVTWCFLLRLQKTSRFGYSEVTPASTFDLAKSIYSIVVEDNSSDW